MSDSSVPYPHPSPVPGSNAIGAFRVGISQIGTISPFDIYATVENQYAASPRLLSLLSSMAAAIDPTENFDDYYDNIFNWETAVGVGLDIWGRIVGVGRVLTLPANDEFLGFQEAGSWQPFGQAPFYSGGGATSNFSLQDAAYRPLIQAKAAANIWNGSIPALNSILLNLFAGRGNSYCTDGLNLTMTYTFKFALQPVDLAIVSSGVLPRPPGVSVTIVQL
jgi:Protein of unknown function (DUF2612)